MSPREGRKFAWTLAGAFAVLALVTWWRHPSRATVVLGALAAAFALAGLLIPGRLGPVQAAWMGLAHAMSKVTTPIFMGVVYYLVFTPIGAMRRAVGGNALRQGHGKSSAWMDRSASPRSDLTRQF